MPASRSACSRSRPRRPSCSSRAHPADVLLLEVGLGGRFDATNVVPTPAATVVTPGLDGPSGIPRRHASRPSPSRRPGILKRGVPAIFADQDPAALGGAAAPGRAASAPGRSSAGRISPATRSSGRLVYQDERGPARPAAAAPRRAGTSMPMPATAIAALRAVRARPAGCGLRGRARCGRLAGPPAAAAARAPAGHRARAAPSSGSTAATMPRAAACWPRRWPRCEDRSTRPLVLVCGMLTTKDPRGLPGAVQGPGPGTDRRAGRGRP